MHASAVSFPRAACSCNPNGCGDQRRYYVSKGQSVLVEFAYERSGESTQTVNVGFYVSTNNVISTAERLIKTFSTTLGRADVYTTRVAATIPADLVSGTTYYLGAYVDYDNKITKVDSANNAAYPIIRIH